MATHLTLANGGGGAQPAYHRSKSAMTSQREKAEQEALDVLAGEVCSWLSHTLRIDTHRVTPDSFMDSLDTGVELCGLADLIQTKAKDSVKGGVKITFRVPTKPIQCHKTAKKGSFLARENAKHFTEWCREVGIKDDLLFESNGLVEHSDKKRVVLCILEVSRYARQVHIKAPKIVEIEHRIDEGEKGGVSSPTAVNPPDNGEETKNLDSEIQSRVKKCKCSSKKLTIVEDRVRPMPGKYVASGGKIRTTKIIHVRRLSNTIMVRVGGGWVTLDSFILDHDLCRIEELP